MHACTYRDVDHVLGDAERWWVFDPDTEWKVTYVGKADDTSRDQVLDSSLIGPVTKGASKFTYVVR